MPAKDCPRCSMTNPPEAQRCDCGYDFARRQVLDSYLTSKDRRQMAREAEAREESERAFGLLPFGGVLRLAIRLFHRFSR